MIKNLLRNLGYDELQEMLPDGLFDKVIDYKKHLKINDDEKTILSTIIYLHFSTELPGNEKLRRMLIERMSKLDIATITGVEENRVNTQVYDSLIKIASERPYLFMSKIGIGEGSVCEDTKVYAPQNILNISPNYGLYPYQKKISNKAVEYINKNKRFLIHLPTGAGKTRTAMNVICNYLRRNEKRLVLWLSNRDELCLQALKEIEYAWKNLGDSELSVYSFFSETNTSLSGIDAGVIVGGLQKLTAIRKSKKSEDLLNYSILAKNVTLVVFDEAHQAIAPTYKNIVNDFCNDLEQKTSLMGLTATPGRNYGSYLNPAEDEELAEFFSMNKISMDLLGYSSPISFLEDEGYLAKANFIPLEYNTADIIKYDLSLSENKDETLRVLSNDKERNLTLLRKIKDEVENSAYVIVFASSVEHAQLMATLLTLSGINSVSLDSKFDNQVTRRNKIQDYKNGKIRVLCNFNILTAGFDAPKTNVAFIAKPVNSLVQYIQMAGRAMRGRRSGGNDECRIYTVMDDIPEFRNLYKAFSYWDKMWGDE